MEFKSDLNKSKYYEAGKNILSVATVAVFVIILVPIIGTKLGISYFSNRNAVEIIRLEAEDIYNLSLIDSVIFVDAREKRFFDGLHITGAISVPYSRKSGWKKTELGAIEMGRPLVLYCDSKVCSMSSYLAQYLGKAGFERIYILSGGIDTWLTEGYPVESVGIRR